MSYLRNERGDIVLYDTFNKSQKLIEFANTPTAAINTIIFLRIVKSLMRKPQIHSALKIGQCSELDATLAEILPKFLFAPRLTVRGINISCRKTNSTR